MSLPPRRDPHPEDNDNESLCLLVTPFQDLGCVCPALCSTVTL